MKAALNSGGGEVDDLMERLTREQLHPNHYFIFCLKEHLLYARYKVRHNICAYQSAFSNQPAILVNATDTLLQYLMCYVAMV